MSKHIEIKFTQKELIDIIESLNTMRGMVGAMDQDFNRECEDGVKSLKRAFKRSGVIYPEIDYSEQNSFRP